MKKVIVFFTLFSILLVFNSCSSDKNGSEPESTKLELTVKDNLENIVSNASVKLYSTLTDLNNQTNQIGETQYSDATGKVIFDNLSAENYFWLAENGCSNNLNSTFNTTSPLTSNITNVLNTDISETGTLKFTNNASSQAEIIVGGDHFFIEAGAILYLYKKSGENIMVQVISPSFLLLSINLGCGETQSINII